MPRPAGPAAALTRRLAIAAAPLACAVALAACGGSDDDGKAKRPEGLPADFNLQVFACQDWNRAGKPVREYVVRRMHELASDQITGPGVEGRGSVLTDEQTHRLFDTRCADPRARGFVLYKLYAFARGYGGGRGPGS